MQIIQDAYDKLTKYFKKQGVDNTNIMNSDSEERFFRKIFEKSNLPFANSGSLTVSIEDDLANTWQQFMENELGELKVNINPDMRKDSEVQTLSEEIFQD